MMEPSITIRISPETVVKLKEALERTYKGIRKVVRIRRNKMLDYAWPIRGKAKIRPVFVTVKKPT